LSAGQTSFENAHTDLPRERDQRTPALIRLEGSPSHGGQYHCPKARQLTLFYRLLPYLGRIGAPARPESGIHRAGSRPSHRIADN